jgi:protein-S-isoprenylcysteine O-methyltransferase Ste14
MKLLIPPPLWAALAGVLIWAAARFLPQFAYSFPGQSVVANSFFGAAIGLGVVAVAIFLMKGTTISPHTPQKTSSLVTTGLYSFSRNPMYLALLLALIGFAVARGHPLGLLPVVGFVIVMEVLQIRPEEAMLEEKFGDAYRAYKARVRRWI